MVGPSGRFSNFTRFRRFILSAPLPEDAVGPYAEAFYKHLNRRPKCNEQMPSFTPDIDIP